MHLKLEVFRSINIESPIEESFLIVREFLKDTNK